MSTTAQAHPNIALVKYWGKQDGTGNLPATPSLSITLDTLQTTTTVEAAQGSDRVYFDDKAADDPKILAFLAELRRLYDIPPLTVRTQNNFPAGAGLASSASGFAALTTAIDAECELGLSRSTLSALARMGSGSAARSIFGGFVALEGPAWEARQVLAPTEWPLTTIVVITSSEQKRIPSTTGIPLSKQTSPYFPAWVTSTRADFDLGLLLVARRDFDALAELAEQSCLTMHALMLSTRPPLLYWNTATMACIEAIREMGQAGLSVFFTIDAGPQVKAVCLPQAAEEVRSTLQQISGVEQVLTAGLGNGASICLS